jgi:putative Mg2+ transporter-C (MgtC) family protein
MSLFLQAETFFLVLIAAFLSMIIGLDRERRDHPAGMRTHMLVGIGSCLFTVLSIHAFSPGDPGRVASQILPGMGFLGAGAILKTRSNIHGMTTAASVWSTAAVGMTVGVGAWLLALATTVTIWVVLAVLRRLEQTRLRTKPMSKTTSEIRNNRDGETEVPQEDGGRSAS